jgi:hypothetical protein
VSTAGSLMPSAVFYDGSRFLGGAYGVAGGIHLAGSL